MGRNVVGWISILRRAYFYLFDATIPLPCIDEEAQEKGDGRPERQR